MSANRLICCFVALAIAQVSDAAAQAGELPIKQPAKPACAGGENAPFGRSGAPVKQGLPGAPQRSSQRYPQSPLDHQRYDQDDARKALLSGKTLPLTAILAIVEKRTPGPVMAVELETHAGRLIYDIVVLGKDGRKVTLELDARTGEILRVTQS